MCRETFPLLVCEWIFPWYTYVSSVSKVHIFLLNKLRVLCTYVYKNNSAKFRSHLKYIYRKAQNIEIYWNAMRIYFILFSSICTGSNMITQLSKELSVIRNAKKLVKYSPETEILSAHLLKTVIMVGIIYVHHYMVILHFPSFDTERIEMVCLSVLTHLQVVILVYKILRQSENYSWC